MIVPALQEVGVQKKLQAIEQHKQHVGGGNKMLAWQREMKDLAEYQRQQRYERYLQEQSSPGGVASECVSLQFKCSLQ